MTQRSRQFSVPTLALPPRSPTVAIALATVGVATVIVAFTLSPGGAAAVAPRTAIPARTVSQLRAVALRFAADNGDSSPQSITAVASTHARALTIATPGDSVASGAGAPV
jgi:hypothetical protein